MTIKWFGHSCFLLTSGKGTALLADPCDPGTGYTVKDIRADAVTSSHAHHDHNYFAAAPGAVRITEAGRHQVKDVEVEGFSTWHDGKKGVLRGGNVMFMFRMDSVNVLHAGDLGHLPDADTVKAMGPVDVLLVPVGGIYTIDYREAVELMRMLGPKVTIPMHYRTDALRFNLGELAPFLKYAKGCAVHRMRQSEAVLTPDTLGGGRIIVLDYAED